MRGGGTLGVTLVFCAHAADAADFVTATAPFGSSTTRTIADAVAAGDGDAFCWAGERFGRLTNADASGASLLGSTNVSAHLSCAPANVFAGQCALNARGALILTIFIILILVSTSVLCCFACGACKCCNLPGDPSRWGCCRRFCPGAAARCGCGPAAGAGCCGAKLAVSSDPAYPQLPAWAADGVPADAAPAGAPRGRGPLVV